MHLSDLHFRSDEQHKWDENIVLKALLGNVKGNLESGLHPNFIAVTGDISYKGKQEGYKLAKEFFDELLGVTKLQKDRLFIVPGNHDVNQDAITPMAKNIVTFLNNREAINNALTIPEDRHLILLRFNNYGDFINSYFAGHPSFNDEHYFYVSHLGLKEFGYEIAVMGLNSAWKSCGNHQERGQLV
jgi:hypothetical protein